MSKINKQHYRDVNMTRLETWLGKEKIAQLRASMKGWYGRPICLIDCPGSVWIHADGSFTGTMNRGYFASAMDSLEDWLKRVYKESGRLQYGQLNVGFTSISDALARASGGNSQRIQFNKVGSTNAAVAATTTLWRVGPQPVGGNTSGAAPGGTVHTKADTGALLFANPSSGTLHLVGADVACNTAGSTLLLYDRLFSVQKTMASTATEAVTGVPTRYQSTTATAADYIGDNFLFIETGLTTLSATAHNWTVCQYNDQNGTGGQTLPSVTGNSGSLPDRLDQPLSQWFAPLGGGDVGIQKLTQMQCSASVASGVINFVIGHPIGFLSFPLANMTAPFDWLTNRDQAPRVFDDACLTFLEPLRSASGSAIYTGRLQLTSAA